MNLYLILLIVKLCSRAVPHCIKSCFNISFTPFIPPIFITVAQSNENVSNNNLNQLLVAKNNAQKLKNVSKAKVIVTSTLFFVHCNSCFRNTASWGNYIFVSQIFSSTEIFI